MDAGPSAQRRETKRKRVSSPNAAKRGAELASAATRTGLRRLGKVLLNELHDDSPALLVPREGLGPARQRDLVKA